jgi:ribosomal protein S12 methylthiotransferase
MRRGITAEATHELIHQIRQHCPDAAIRTTLITGYPGEKGKDFELLKKFVEENRFERLGVFTYSHEENTPAFKLNDDVPDSVKRERADEIMELQEKISYDLNQDKIGTSVKVIIDRQEGDYYIGRTEHDSPDIDNEILVKKTEQNLQRGSLYNIKITGAESFDLYGSFTEHT